MKGTTVYALYYGNCDESNESLSGVYVERVDAEEAARLTAEEVYEDTTSPDDGSGMYSLYQEVTPRMSIYGICVPDSSYVDGRLPIDWWRVKPITLR